MLKFFKHMYLSNYSPKCNEIEHASASSLPLHNGVQFLPTLVVLAHLLIELSLLKC